MSSDKRAGISVDEIQIEDPLDFLSVTEKEAYLRSRQAHQPQTQGARAQDVYAARQADTYAPEQEDAYDAEQAPYAEDAAAYEYDAALTYDAPRAGRQARTTEAEKNGRTKAATGQGMRREKAPAQVPDTALDKGLALAVRLGLAVILVLTAYMAWLIVLRPMVRSVMGLNTYEADAAASEEIDETIETTAQLNLRNAPNTQSSEIIVTVPAGTRMTRIAEANGWSTVIYEGQTLYCSSEYVKAAE